MKFSKLALASVAALGLAGVAQADPTYYVEESLEDWGYYGAQSTLATPQTGANVYGQEQDGQAVWFGAAAEDTAVLVYSNNAASATIKFPTKNGEPTSVGSKYLKVSNSSTLWRMFRSYSKVGETQETMAWPAEFPTNGTDVVVGSSGIYVDTLVQFTPSEDPPTVEDGSKLIVWMNTNGVLCVTGGKLKWDGNQPEAEKTDFITTETIQTNTWYRLTVSAFGNIMIGAALDEGWVLNGFEVRIDGHKVTVAEPQIVADGGFTDPIDPQDEDSGGLIARECVNAQVAASIVANQFFGSLQPAGRAATLAAVGFKGEGFVDDIIVSDLLPTFTAGVDGIDFTLTWDADVSAVWYSIDGGTPVAATKDAKVTVENATAGTTKVILTGTAADAWSFVAEVTNTLSDAQNAWTVASTAYVNGEAAGVSGGLAGFSATELKTAFNGASPAEINAAANAYMDYQFGQTLNTLSAAPTLKIVDIAENATDGWDIKVQVLNGATPLAVDNGSEAKSSPLRATLTAIASATLEGFPAAPSKNYELVFDSTTTDLTVTVPAADGQFFKAYIKYAVPANNQSND